MIHLYKVAAQPRQLDLIIIVLFSIVTKRSYALLMATINIFICPASWLQDIWTMFSNVQEDFDNKLCFGW